MLAGSGAGAVAMALMFGSVVVQASPLAYVPRSDRGEVAVIDTGAGSVRAVVKVGSAPYGIAARPDGSSVYVTNSASNTVAVVDILGNVVAATVPVGSNPVGIAVHPDGDRVYVANAGSNSVSVIDTRTNEVTATIAVGVGPVGLALIPDGTRAYVTDNLSRTVSVVDTATNRVARTIAVGNSPFGVAVHPAGAWVYVTHSGFPGDFVSVIDAGTDTLSTTVAVGSNARGVAVHPDGTRVYVASSGPVPGTVTVIDAARNAVTAIIPVGISPFGVAVDPAGGWVYVANYDSGTLSIIDAARETLAGTVAVDGALLGLGYFLAPLPTAVEYYHSAFDHYFVTASVEEISKLDAGDLANWARTGESFEVYPLGTAASADVCRFWSGQTFVPKSSHFLTPLAEECAIVKRNADWQFEGEAFAVTLPDGQGRCSEPTVPLYRLYNDGQGGAPNHRYTTRWVLRAEMIDRGWIAEGVGDDGVIACVPR